MSSLANSTVLRDRQQKVADLRLKGRTHREIAAAIGVGHATVQRDLAKVEAHWQDLAAQDIGVFKAREVARLELVIREAWSGYESSRQSKTLTATEDVVIEGEIRTLESKRTTAPDGDWHFLDVVVRASAQIARNLNFGSNAEVRIRIDSYIELVARELGVMPSKIWDEIDQVKAMNAGQFHLEEQ